ncbi:MAG: hypothetical protein ACM3JD_10620 [Rudaea sp.]
MNTNPPSRRYRSAQVFFGIIFLISTCFLLLVLTNLRGQPTAAPPPAQTAIAAGTATSAALGTPTLAPPPSPGPTPDNSIVTFVLPVVASALSLLGFVSTTFLAWRKERRDARIGDLELERAKLELEKTRMELDKLKGPGPNP